jgi:glycosyltransferase involved in cell wall biosynthesis
MIETIPVAIVIPCLNEELVLRETCKSLGFGCGTNGVPIETYLILVDNGSNDNTISIMKSIQERSPDGSVFMVSEEERGYVPPRHRGVLKAREIAAAERILEQCLLILQADADTQYSVGYVAAMRNAASGHIGNFLVEGVSNPLRGFDLPYQAYRALSDRIDAPLQKLLVDECHDVIIGDNISGYMLQDYFSWGGHRREYNKNGDEIYAETSRLYIKAKLLGARKLKVPDAIGYHSRRKILQNPVLHFATAGFPRELSWCAAWNRSYAGPNKLEAFGSVDIDRELQHAIFIRQAHSLILFGLLPVHIAVLLGQADQVLNSYSRVHELLRFVRHVSKEEIMGNAAFLFEHAFSIIDFHPDVLKAHFAN